MIPYAFLALSAIIHAAVIIALSWTFEKQEEQKQEKPNVVTVNITIKEKGQGTLGCKESYSGVGFTYHPFSEIIVDVPKGYPAYKAGIRPGDVLLDAGKPRKRTGPAIIRVMRDGKELTFTIPQEPICVDK